MSRENDLDTIMQLLPQPPDVKPEDRRHNFEKLSDGELIEIRASLVSISKQELSPKWEAALKEVRNLLGLKPLLEELDGHNQYIQDRGWFADR